MSLVDSLVSLPAGASFMHMCWIRTLAGSESCEELVAKAYTAFLNFIAYNSKNLLFLNPVLKFI